MPGVHLPIAGRRGTVRINIPIRTLFILVGTLIVSGCHRSAPTIPVAASNNEVTAPPSEASTSKPEKSDDESVEVSSDSSDALQAPAETPAPAPVPTENWTSQRMIVTGQGGPRFFKFDMNIGGQELRHGFESALSSIAEELEVQFERPIGWNELLDKPLIASGWLGNLVPNSDQREQLRGLYDQNKDDKVDEAEFREFITRGLYRNSAVKLRPQRSSAPQSPNGSLWGPIDTNADGELSAEELAQVSQSILRYDFDADRMLTPMELRTATEADPSEAMNSSELTPVFAWDIDKPKSLASLVLKNYSYGVALTNDLLYAWPHSKRQLLDTNGDSSIDEFELEKVNDSALDACFQFRFPNQHAPDVMGQAKENASVNFTALDQSTTTRWLSHPEGGRLTLDGCIVTIVLNDEQSDGLRAALALQIERSENDPQFQAVAMRALELKDGALELLTTTASARGIEARGTGVALADDRPALAGSNLLVSESIALV